MLRANRIPGPIGRQTVGSSHQAKRAENDWISINPLDVAQGWTFRQSSQANLVNLSTSASGIRVQQDISKNAIIPREVGMVEVTDQRAKNRVNENGLW